MASKKEIHYLKFVGENITRLRKKKGITSKQLADMCDIEKSNLTPIEKGRINVTLSTLAKIATALDVELRDLFDK